MAEIVTLNNATSGASTAAPVRTVINTDPVVANEGTQGYQDMVNDAVPAAAGGNSAVGDALAVVEGAGNLNQNNNAGLESAEGIVGDPAAFLTPEMSLSDNVPTIDAESGLIDADADKYAMDTSGLNTEVSTATAQTVDDTPTNPGAVTYEAVSTTEDVADAAGTAEQGVVSEEAIIDAPEIDIKGTATGINKDGTVNYTGQALTQFASQNISTMIDTSTVAGKLLAQTLGEGNYTDTKATVMGQLQVISEQFEGPNGEPIIPSWAQSTARNVSRIAAFKGMTGTAATAAMSTAIMEATLPIAQQEATFFQTVTLKNLDNKQQMTINKANVLSKMDQLNADYKLQAAIQNSKNFMSMDLKNLDNKQQMAVINTQARVQSIFEDAKATNAAEAFAAKSENDLAMFYDNLQSVVSRFNTDQLNQMAKFTAGEINDNNEFNANLENNREQYYTTMQFNLDKANAKWRQDVTLKNAEMVFEAAALDVKNLFDITTESLTRLWDRADSLLDYAWKTSEKALDREATLMAAQIQGGKKKGGLWGALGGLAGTLLGTEAGSTAAISGIAKVFSWFSDVRLKEDIKFFAKLDNGINVYRWKWNEEGKRLGADANPAFGVLAQEVQDIFPDAIEEGADGYLRVNYGMIV